MHKIKCEINQRLILRKFVPYYHVIITKNIHGDGNNIKTIMLSLKFDSIGLRRDT